MVNIKNDSVTEILQLENENKICEIETFRY